MQLTIDGTPLLGARTGIGRYVAALVNELSVRSDLTVSASAFTIRAGERPADLPETVRWRRSPVPARAMQALWARAEFPAVEWLAGRGDVFHGTNFLLPPLRRARGVLSVHDLSFVRYPDAVAAASLAYRDLVPRGIARAAIVCTPTQAVANEVAAEYGVASERIHVTPLGVDAVWFDAAPLSTAELAERGLPSSYFLAVGTLEPRKNLGTLIAAMRRVAPDHDLPPLVLVGPKGWGPALELDALPPGSVLLTDYVDDVTLRRLVAGARCLAFPSKYEGFGLPPLEALACGVPVVASDLPVTREVLGPHATFVQPGDVDALAEALVQTLGNAERDATASAARREWARAWTWNRCAETTVEAYRLALQ